MSDFDKEAERERLREKYERDRESRQSTQRMSELLLKGATMTNRHCGECGSPIFRQDGAAFCPTCDAGDGASEEATPEAGSADADADADAGVEVAVEAESTDVAPEPAPEPATTGADADTGTEGETGADAAGTATTGEPVRTVADAGDPRPESESEPGSESARPPADAGAAVGDADADHRGAARASLERTLARFAREAESAADPRAARDSLAAAREAAEALAALDRR